MRKLATHFTLWSLLALGGVWVLGAAFGLVGSCATAEAQTHDGGGYLGVVVQGLTPELRESYGYRGDGVLVNRVEPESPADRAGVRAGDILVRLQGRLVADPDDLRERVRRHDPGDHVNLSVWRDGRERALRATLGEASARERAPRAERREGAERHRERVERHRERAERQRERAERRRERNEPHRDQARRHVYRYRLDGDGPGRLRDLGREMRAWLGHWRLGVQVQDLSPDLGAYFDAPDGRGVLVTEVVDESPAVAAGFKAGDVILAVDGVPVADVDELRRELAEKEAGEVRVEVLRHGERRTLTAELEERPGLEGLADGRVLRIPRIERRELRRGRSEEMRALREELRELKRELEDLRRELGERER